MRIRLQVSFCILNISFRGVLLITIDEERFAGLNIRGFSTIKVFSEIFSHCLGHKYSLISIIQEGHVYSRKNFHGTPKTVKTQKFSPAIFYDLNYTILLTKCEEISSV